MFAGSCCGACPGAWGCGASRKDLYFHDVMYRCCSVSQESSLSTIANEQCHQPCKKTSRVNSPKAGEMKGGCNAKASNPWRTHSRCITLTREFR